MTISLSPILNGWQGFGTTGLPLNAGQIFQYAAGTTTPISTFTTNTGLVQNANPIILGADGRPPQEIWLTDGLSYKFVLMDSLSNLIATYDNIQSVGTLIQNFFTSNTFLTQGDGRYPIYAGVAGGTSDAITATASTNITSLYNGMIVSIDAVAANISAIPTFTLTLGSTTTATMTIVDNNLQALSAGAIAGVGHKLLLGANLIQSKWVLINPQYVVPSAGTVSKRQTALIGPIDVTGMPSLLPQTATGLTLTTQNIAAIETTQTSIVTFTNGSAIIGWAANTLVVNQAVSFTTTASLPTNFAINTVYYVVSTGLSGAQFEVAATPGGTPIVAGSAGSGTQTGYAGVQLPLTATAYYGNDGITGELNVVGQATANFSFPTLTNTATNYLYSTISNNGILTHFVTTLAPVINYGPISTPSITNGQITIDVVRCEVYLGNGSAAVETPLIVWGTATTAGGNITATQTYLYGKPPTFASKKSGTLIKRTTFASSGTWIKSAQTTGINVTVVGGGGAGAFGGSSTSGVNSGGGGGAGGDGGIAIGFFDATTINSVAVTIAVGGTSSFGALISATAGSAGSVPAGAIAGPGAAGGIGSGGDINLSGSVGATGAQGIFGASQLGGSGGGPGGGLCPAVNGAGNGAQTQTSLGKGGGGGAGAGCSGGSFGGGAGSPGTAGYVIVDEYA